MESSVQATIGYLMRGKTTLYGWCVCGLGALFYCYEYFLRISPSVMTHDLMRSYHISAALLGNLAAFYYYAYTPMQLPVGLMMDRYGPRRLLVLACLLCAFGTYLFAGSNHLYLAGIGRFLVGFGSAFAFVGVLKLATIWLPPNRFAMIAGMATALGMLGATAGDNLLAMLVEKIGWQHTILISAFAGVILAFLILLVLPDDNSILDSHMLGEPTGFKLLIIGLLQLFKNPQMWLVGVVGCLLYLPTSAFAELWGIPYVETVFGLSASAATGAVSMIFLGWAVGGPIVGLVSDKLQLRRSPLVIGSLIAAVLITVALYTPALSKSALYITLFIFGVFSSVENIVFAVGREISPRKLSGTAIALTNMLVMLGGVLFQPIIGVLLDWKWDGTITNGVPIYSIENYKFALAVMPVGLIVCAFISLFLRETHGKLTEK